MTREEYLVWEPLQELRYEYWEGEAVAMTGGTIPHNDIALNLYRALYPYVRDRGCRVNVADVKVDVAETGRYFYPDLVVSCDARDRTAIQLLQFPTLIVEVLSPATEANDRGDKFKQYMTLPTLREYVMVDAESISVECYRRGEGRMWLYFPYAAGDVITLESLGFACPIEQLYEDVQLSQSAGLGASML